MKSTIIPITHKLTVEDYRAMPEGPPWYQLIDGVLMVQESPTDDHQLVVFNLALALGNWAKRTGRASVRTGPLDVWLSEHNVFQPDILVVLKERNERLRRDGVHGAPDLVVEVLSSSTRAADRGIKRKTYARAGVRELWLADPETRIIQTYRFVEDDEYPVSDAIHGDTLTTPLLQGFAVEVAGLFED